MSGAIARYPAEATAFICRRQVYEVSGNPWQKRTAGPSPCSATCKEMPFVAMSDSLIGGPSNLPKLFALATRPKRRLAPTAVLPARKDRREIAEFEIADLSSVVTIATVSCWALNLKSFSLLFIVFTSRITSGLKMTIRSAKTMNV